MPVSISERNDDYTDTVEALQLGYEAILHVFESFCSYSPSFDRWKLCKVNGEHPVGGGDLYKTIRTVG